MREMFVVLTIYPSNCHPEYIYFTVSVLDLKRPVWASVLSFLLALSRKAFLPYDFLQQS
jgi:hypothetical protein